MVKSGKRKKSSRSRRDFYKGLGFGALAGISSIVASHPGEHFLYGQGKRFFPHLGMRLLKGTVASAAGYGTYHYLTQNEQRIDNYLKRVRKSRKKSKRKYFK
jgi:hypothetical protein